MVVGAGAGVVVGLVVVGAGVAGLAVVPVPVAGVPVLVFCCWSHF